MSDIQGIFFKNFANSYIPEILKELYRDRVYDPYVKNRQDMTVMDVGCNIGLFTQYIYPFAKKIYSVEPSATHCEVINQLVTFNKMDKVTIIQKALSHENGTATFYHNDNVTMFSLKPEVNGRPDEAEIVETITLEKMMADYKIDHVDFMKLDVEGSEQDIIGSRGFENVAGKIDTIMGEHHVWSGKNPQLMANTLRDYGFKFEWIPNDAQLFVATRL